MAKKGQYTLKHYIWLLLWGFALYYAIAHNSIMASFLFLIFFFIFNTLKHFVYMLIAGFIVPTLVLILTLLAGIPVIGWFIDILIFSIVAYGVIKKWDKFEQNLKAILIGLFLYGVHILVLLFNVGINIFNWAKEISVDDTVTSYPSIVFAVIATIILHLFIRSLYARNYTTGEAFAIMGLAPYTILTLAIPFLPHGEFEDLAAMDDLLDDLDSDSIREALKNQNVQASLKSETAEILKNNKI